MNFITKITPNIRIILSLSILASSAIYTYINNIDPIAILYTIIVLFSINIVIAMPKMLTVALITVIQAIYLTSMIYALQTALNPSYAILFSILALAISVLITIVMKKYALGRLWLNQIVVYIIFDTAITMSYFALMSNHIDLQVLYLIIGFLVPFLFIIAKNSILARKIIKPVISSNINSKNTILHNKITKLLNKEKINSISNNGLITRYVQAGDRMLFIHEPSNIGKTQISSIGILFDGKDYSSYLEEFIKQAIKTANLHKINKNKIMPIIILHDYKDNKILNVRVFSNVKPDISIGAVYVCSPNGLVKLIKNLEAKSKVKPTALMSEKYKLIKNSN